MSFQIIVPVDDVSKKMFLRQELATATLDDGKEIEIAQVIPSGDLHFSIGDARYLVKLPDILQAILEQEAEET